MTFALMGKVLCASRKIERRSNVIQRLFKRSCVIAKAFLPPKKNVMQEIPGEYLFLLQGNLPRSASWLEWVPIFPSDILVSSLQILLLHGSRLSNSSGEVQQKGLIPCLRRKTRLNDEPLLLPIFCFRIFLCHLTKASFFSVLLESSIRLCTPCSWTTVSIHWCTSSLHFLFTLYQPYHFYIMNLLNYINIVSLLWVRIWWGWGLI